MGKGYGIIVEPRRLDPLIGEPKYWEYVNATFHWLIEELYQELGDQLANIEIDVIRMERFGTAYPAIALEHKLDFQFEEFISETCDRLLRERPISELVEFIATSNIDWKTETARLMKDNFNPAVYNRSEVRRELQSKHPEVKGLDERAGFRTWLELTYKKTREGIVKNRRDEQLKRTLFLSAIGLLTYGDLDTIPDILDHIPWEPPRIRMLAWVLKEILPLPASLNPFETEDAIKAWVQNNSANLRWEENVGKFTLIEATQT